MRFKIHFTILVAFIAFGHLAACSNAVISRPVAEQKKAVLSGKAYVYDGDSLFFGRAEVRLNGIDAPELKQACKHINGQLWPCGKVARDYLARLIGNHAVRCVIKGKDKYKRLLGTCYTGSRDLNQAMVRSGNAIAYLYFSDRYAREQLSAKEAQAGIWQDPHFTDPYYCRHKTSGHGCETD